MNKKGPVESKPMKAIRKFALRYPEVAESPSCVNRAFKSRGKSFLFLGMNESTYNLRLKLRDSLPELEKLSKKSPDQYEVGLHGWTLIRLPHSTQLPASQIEKWIDESFRLLAPKQLVPEPSATKPASPSTKKKPVKKK